MSLNAVALVKAFQSLRKSLKADFESASPEQIHQIRTRARRIETLLGALLLNDGGRGKRLSKAVTKIRKQAGRVRDMDVLLQYAATLSSHEDEECLVPLLAYLGTQREEFATNFRSVLKKIGRRTSRDVKRTERYLEKHLDQTTHPDSTQRAWDTTITARALGTSAALAEWQKLDAHHLHEFRLQVKQLSDLLKVMEWSKTKLQSHLTTVKDAIGVWHDWYTLASIASNVLESQKCTIKRDIDATIKHKLTQALAVARSFRKNLSPSLKRFGPFQPGS
jgi:CHAD domain-containing protein